MDDLPALRHRLVSIQESSTDRTRGRRRRPALHAAAMVLVGLTTIAASTAAAADPASPSVAPATAPRATEAGPGAQLPDTAGAGLLEWTYDTWTVPWVQVSGTTKLDPGSYVTLVTLACEGTVIEHERLARHLSPEECEHRMAAVRADHDTALVFRVHLRLLGPPGSGGLVRLDRNIRATLEDDAGWRWSPPDVRRGAGLGMATNQKVRRVPIYHPQWVRGSDLIHPDPYRASQGRGLTIVEYSIRFPRRSEEGERLLTGGTRWLRLRLSDGRNEWVATWPFARPQEVSR